MDNHIDSCYRCGALYVERCTCPQGAATDASLVISELRRDCRLKDVSIKMLQEEVLAERERRRIPIDQAAVRDAFGVVADLRRLYHHFIHGGHPNPAMDARRIGHGIEQLEKLIGVLQQLSSPETKR